MNIGTDSHRQKPCSASDYTEALVEAATQGNVGTINELLLEVVGGPLKSRTVSSGKIEPHQLPSANSGSGPSQDDDGKRDSKVELGDVINMAAKNGQTPLMAASASGKEKAVFTLLDIMGEADVNSRGQGQQTALMVACRKDTHVGVVHALVTNGADIDLVDSRDRTALMYASRNHCPEITKLLVGADARKHLKDRQGNTALMLASEQGNMDIVSCLLNNGASVNARNYEKDDALMIASAEGHLEVVQELMRFGAKLNGHNIHAETAAILACKRGHFKVATYLETVRPRRRCHRGKTLQYCAIYGLSDAVKELLAAGIDPNENDGGPLQSACKYADFKTVQVLIQGGANVTKASGMSPLGAVLCNTFARNPVEKVELLLASGVDPNSQVFPKGPTALNRAVTTNRQGIVPCLMKAGARVNNEIHLAIKQGSRKIVRELLVHGALPSLRSLEDQGESEQTSPLKLALQLADESTARYFVANRFMIRQDLRRPDNLTHFSALNLDVVAKILGLISDVYSQPWKLKTLSFLTVSICVGFEMGRDKRVTRLPLPNQFKKALMFRNPEISTEIDQWKDLDVSL